jgi:hypothetical protein
MQYNDKQSSMLERLPTELIHAIVCYLPLPSYCNLRSSSKQLSYLDAVPTLGFAAYRESVFLLRSAVVSTHRMKLQLLDLSQESFLFICMENVHPIEFNRVLKSHQSSRITASVKNQAFQMLVSESGNPEMALALIKSGEVDPTVSVSYDPLFWAAKKGYESLVIVLLESKNIDSNTIDFQGNGPIHMAAYNAHFSALKLLLAHKNNNHTAKGNMNRNILHFGAFTDGKEMMQYILNNTEVDANVADIGGAYPIHIAAENRNKYALEALVGNSKVDINVLNNRRRSSLLLSCRKNRIDAVKLLLSCEKLDAHIRDDRNDHPLRYAASIGNLAMVKAIMDNTDVPEDILKEAKEIALTNKMFSVMAQLTQ